MNRRTRKEIIIKRMRTIVRHEATGRIIFYLKGADSMMVNKVSENLRGFVLD